MQQQHPPTHPARQTSQPCIIHTRNKEQLSAHYHPEWYIDNISWARQPTELVWTDAERDRFCNQKELSIVCRCCCPQYHWLNQIGCAVQKLTWKTKEEIINFKCIFGFVCFARICSFSQVLQSRPRKMILWCAAIVWPLNVLWYGSRVQQSRFYIAHFWSYRSLII